MKLRKEMKTAKRMIRKQIGKKFQRESDIWKINKEDPTYV